MTQFTAPHSTQTLVKLLRAIACTEQRHETVLQAGLLELEAENKHLLDDLMAVRDDYDI